MVFYRKYRPQKFSEIFGQEHIKEVLLESLKSGKISHGYLFSGPRGSGKTSTARILAKALNCEIYSPQSTVNQFGEPCGKCQACLEIADGSYLDLIEIDAASNRGIDEIRDLREKIKLSPVSGRFKTYIIDEVHMLTPEAFNALLKTLEEPPAHAIFVLCTTAPEKLPHTIVSRLTRFNFKRASVGELEDVLKKVASQEKIKIEDDALLEIAKASDGAFRDALSFLQQFSSTSKKVTREDVKNLVKTTDANTLYDFLEKLGRKDLKGAVAICESLEKNTDIATFVKDAILLLKKLLFKKIGVEVGFTREEEHLENKFTYREVQELLKLFLLVEGEIKLYPLPQIPLVLAVCKYCPEPQEGILGEVVEMPPPTKTEESSPDTQKTEEKEISTSSLSVKKVKNGKISLADVEAHWSEFLKTVRPVNAHVVALLRSTKPHGFDGKTLTLEVFFRFHKDKLEEPKILNLLCKNLSDVMGEKVALKMVLADKKTKPTKTVLASNVSEVESDLAEIAQEIFAK